MSVMKSTQAAFADAGDASPVLRSGAVARMVPMPVATLRIWEQRYQAVRPSTAASGHRRYSAADLQRLRWLRQLVEQGHAIGAIAGLDSEQLQQMLAPPRAPEMKVVVVGRALGARLLRPAVLPGLPRPFSLIAVLDAPGEAPMLDGRGGCDLLLCQLAGLQREVPAELAALQAALPQARLAVVYRYGGADAVAAFSAAGIALLREPPDDAQLLAWLAGLQAGAARTAPVPAALAQHAAPAPRRYDDAALVGVIGMAQQVRCECPRHIAELLLQLASFEQYSAACGTDSPADAALHAQLQRVAALSRTLFEDALDSVVQHVGVAQP